MAQTVCVLLDAAARSQFTAIAEDRSRPLKQILRAGIVLLSAERLNVQDLACRAGVSRPTLWRCQHRYGEDGIEGLLCDKTRPARHPAYHPTRTVAEVLALTCSEPPDAVTHWTGHAVAARIGISLLFVRRIWQAHGLQPHRVRTFKRLHDPALVEKVEDGPPSNLFDGGPCGGC
ncbi:Homeodomain-like domain-containing protein [Methylobacterium pseudosasicola]|uniref:Homeodomain-like domain-containing protein n=1 Tax=Methylobacterium pseudosasicola TaxID=582667 RepID=A0A1I4TFT5_9HYPH|nr:Homeodomain-like domain-containing protein [Methylobacterium pseudosasicola]